MFPSRLKQEPRILALTLVITFIFGANFCSVIMFWPTQAFNVYGHDPTGVGIRGILVGFSILTGACVVLWLLSVFRGHNKELMIVSSVVMTAGKSLTWKYSLPNQPTNDFFRLWLPCMRNRRQPQQTLGTSDCRRPRDWRYCRPSLNHDHYHLPRRPHRHGRSSHSQYPCHWWCCRLYRVLQRVHPEVRPERHLLHWWCYGAWAWHHQRNLDRWCNCHHWFQLFGWAEADPRHCWQRHRIRDHCGRWTDRICWVVQVRVPRQYRFRGRFYHRGLLLGQHQQVYGRPRRSCYVRRTTSLQAGWCGLLHWWSACLRLFKCQIGGWIDALERNSLVLANGNLRVPSHVLLWISVWTVRSNSLISMGPNTRLVCHS